VNGEMRAYQLQGLNWMVSLHHNGLNGILADGMVKSPLLLSHSVPRSLPYCRVSAKLCKPFPSLPTSNTIVTSPVRTLSSFQNPLCKTGNENLKTLDFNVVILQGNAQERAEIIAERLIPQDFEVCITNYEMCLIEKGAFRKFSFEYIVIDEAHRIKNVDSILS
ncbi:hypothetical protein C0992_008447, partial [Termitomyces sp. T32_za158]